MTTHNNDGQSDLGFFLKSLTSAGGFALLAILLYACSVSSPNSNAPGTVGIVGASLVITGASFTVGCLVGFLFGIPRSVKRGVAPAPVEGAGRATQRSGEAVGQSTPPGAREAGERIAFRDNTNLEEISDWLTKILVGVGLTQLQKLPQALPRLAEFLGKGFGDSPLKDVFVLSLAIYSALVGFFFCYLLTRLRLPRALSAASAFMQRLKETQEATERTREQVDDIQRDVERTQQAIDANTPAFIHNALYTAAPDGFQNAIRLGTEYVTKEPRHARTWTYLTCAYAQQYRWEKEHPPVSIEVHAQTKKKAIDACQTAIEMDLTEKPLLQMLWEGKVEQESDLAVFKEEHDPDFARLLGSPPPGATP